MLAIAESPPTRSRGGAPCRTQSDRHADAVSREPIRLRRQHDSGHRNDCPLGTTGRSPIVAGVQLQELRTAFLESPLYREMAAHANGGDVPDSAAKRHHFIPRFLLREFASERDSRHLIFQLEKRTGQPRKVTVDAAASRHRFYAIDDEDGTTHNRVEAYLALVESHAAPAVRRLLNDPAVLRRTDAATIHTTSRCCSPGPRSERTGSPRRSIRPCAC